MRRAAAVVGVHTIHTHTPILAAVTGTVVDVVLTVLTCETWTERDNKRRDNGESQRY